MNYPLSCDDAPLFKTLTWSPWTYLFCSTSCNNQLHASAESSPYRPHFLDAHSSELSLFGNYWKTHIALNKTWAIWHAKMENYAKVQTYAEKLPEQRLEVMASRFKNNSQIANSSADGVMHVDAWKSLRSAIHLFQADAASPSNVSYFIRACNLCYMSVGEHSTHFWSFQHSQYNEYRVCLLKFCSEWPIWLCAPECHSSITQCKDRSSSTNHLQNTGEIHNGMAHSNNPAVLSSSLITEPIFVLTLSTWESRHRKQTHLQRNGLWVYSQCQYLMIGPFCRWGF